MYGHLHGLPFREPVYTSSTLLRKYRDGMYFLSQSLGDHIQVVGLTIQLLTIMLVRVGDDFLRLAIYPNINAAILT